MEYLSKEQMTKKFRNHVSFLIRELTCYTYDEDGTPIPGMTQLQIASVLHLTPSQMSRVTTGVCSLSGPAYMTLLDLYAAR